MYVYVSLSVLSVGCTEARRVLNPLELELDSCDRVSVESQVGSFAGAVCI